ncbi:MAG: formate--phosphoribosylaminoimidazolecarboxamide ligase family protein [Saccharolobus sp.]|uniref:Subunit variant of phosphoribosylaminoimidazolecarboxamide formyltransferase [alternate form] n=1 Tax=Saccharolobus shibatae (strain ATCC 51178 / DSM 5389 / JCM 8931 / NBRC 15437 / B12) TaxID=523848 RepID=A0A8F5BKX1_SACSH|nr:formate--phosphoribosylaminoimidazolecarboxamide ligase family protein [Saccharolobus shibatae]MCH4814428.1 formate--phosphoribosylaminoimidazolecarboxamide ligase family protein [Saccharolobus shibatae]QXJ27162.1 putative subunit variant of phosphoribosylaminoimidazolecarboxamide formyltransferase [alternate form] [Saccharolobus shibatae B12]
MNVKIAALASHSALDVFDGAKDEGFQTIGLCKKGRERPYLEFKAIMDKCMIMDDFKEIISDKVQDSLLSENAIIVPNRSLAVYVGYDGIENMKTKVFGNRYMLRWEERVGEKNYYKILNEGKISIPKLFKPEEIDRPVIVKLPEAKRKVERGFFFAVNKEDFEVKLNELLRNNVIDNEGLKNMVIEEFVFGAHFNLNYFYSPIFNRLELISVDRRIQSDWDSLYRLPADIQIKLGRIPRLIEVGHEPVTIRESLLEKVFEIGYRFVEATQKLEPPGIIGPFTLQVMVTPDLDLVVYDVAPRIGGGTNAYMGIGSQYSKFYFGKPISLGRRIALEIKRAIINNLTEKILT